MKYEDLEPELSEFLATGKEWARLSFLTSQKPMPEGVTHADRHAAADRHQGSKRKLESKLDRLVEAEYRREQG